MSDEPTLRAHAIERCFAHIDTATGIRPLPVDEDFWSRTVAQLPAGRLVSHVETSAPWPTWEMHPHGEELILQLTGSMTLIVEAADGQQARISLHAGHFTVVPAGHWHTADADGPGTALYITWGDGPQVRERS